MLSRKIDKLFDVLGAKMKIINAIYCKACIEMRILFHRWHSCFISRRLSTCVSCLLLSWILCVKSWFYANMLRIVSKLRFPVQRSAILLGENPNVSRPLVSAVWYQERRWFCNCLPSLQKKMYDSYSWIFGLTVYSGYSFCRISVTFVNREGDSLHVKAKVGDTFLDAAINNDVDLEGFG